MHVSYILGVTFIVNAMGSFLTKSSDELISEFREKVRKRRVDLRLEINGCVTKSSTWSVIRHFERGGSKYVNIDRIDFLNKLFSKSEMKGILNDYSWVIKPCSLNGKENELRRIFIDENRRNFYTYKDLSELSGLPVNLIAKAFRSDSLNRLLTFHTVLHLGNAFKFDIYNLWKNNKKFITNTWDYNPSILEGKNVINKS